MFVEPSAIVVVAADAAVADAAVADAANADPLDAAKGRVFFRWLDMRYAPAKPSRGIASSAILV